MNKISVKIVDSKGTHVEDQTFINPPKKASVVLGRLIAAGYAGSLLDKDGNSLCDDDKLDDTQVYRLVLPAPALTGLTFREALACPLPLLEQRNSPRKSNSKTQPKRPRTFSDVLPWEGFLQGSRDLFNGLDNTERLYHRSLVLGFRPGKDDIVRPAADEAEVRGCVVLLFNSINATAEMLGIPMECWSGGSARSLSFTDLLVRPAGAQTDTGALSSQVFGTIEVKGDWQFQLERGERLEDALHDPKRIGGIVQAVQQVYGDAVMDEAPLLILTNYHVTVFLRRSHDVQDKRLWASEPIWFDCTDPPARACWVHALQQAEKLRELKQKLPRAVVPPTFEGYHIESRPQQAQGAAVEQQATAEQQAAEADSAASSKRQRTSRSAPHVWVRTAEEQAGDPSSSGRTLRQQRTTCTSLCLRARSSKGMGYTETNTPVSAEAQPAVASLSNPEAEDMLSLSELNITDELLGAGQYGYTLRGTRDGRPVALKVYNLQKCGAAAAYEQEKLAYGALESLQGVIIPHLLCSGLLQHTAAPVIVTSFEGAAMDEDKRVPPRLHARMRKALEAFHATGAAHGDVRRSNFLVGDGDRVWLIDLGRSVVKASKDEKDQDKQQLKAILR